MRREKRLKKYGRRFLLAVCLMLSLMTASYAAEGEMLLETDGSGVDAEISEDVFPQEAFEKSTSSSISAQHLARNLIEDYADIEKNKEDFDYSDYRYTKSQKRVLRRVAEEAAAGCETDYEKIRAVCRFVADNIYYDYMYYEGYKKDVIIDPYGVWTGKTSVCDGYTRLCKTLLNDLGIACMKISACENSHAYNAAYDSQNDRWIYFDATWCSYNIFTPNGDYNYNGYSDKYFDMDVSLSSRIEAHEIHSAGALTSDESDVCYSLITPYDEDEWDRTDQWSMGVLSARNAKDPSISSIDTDLGGIPVTQIVEFAFMDNKYIKSIAMPDSIVAIDWWSFAHCKKLKTIRFSKSLRTIGKCAFYDCKSLRKAILPNRVERIEPYAFYCCDKLSKISIPKTVVYIGDKIAFGQCNIYLKCRPPVKTTDAFVHLWKCRIYYPAKGSGWTKSVRKKWKTSARWVAQ